MRIVFIGTADIGNASLEALVASPAHQVVGVVTQPDRPVGRKQQLTPPPIKTLALKHNLPVLQPEKVRRPEALAEIRALAPELIVVIAYGQILPRELLEMPARGCVNVHASLLPRWRGASPIQASLLAGDTDTGVTTMLMDTGVDTGPILLQEKLTIAPEDNAGTLHDKLGSLGAKLLLQTLEGMVAGTVHPVPQPQEGACYAPKISKEDGHIDWNLPAQQLHHRLRALTPWPGLFTHLSKGSEKRLLKIHAASVSSAGIGNSSPGMILSAGSAIVVATGAGALAIEELQIEGSRRMSAVDFLRGHPLSPGFILG